VGGGKAGGRPGTLEDLLNSPFGIQWFPAVIRYRWGGGKGRRRSMKNIQGRGGEKRKNFLRSLSEEHICRKYG